MIDDLTTDLPPSLFPIVCEAGRCRLSKLTLHDSLQMFSGRRSEIERRQDTLIKLAANLTKVIEEKTGINGYLLFGPDITVYIRNSHFGIVRIQHFGRFYADKVNACIILKPKE
ncbi:MAG TPA: hypothetical protein VIJ01_10835 [Candidatus Angelobacter sp.]